MKKVLTITTLLLIIVMGIVATAKAQKSNPSKMEASLNVTPNPITFEETYIGEVSSVSVTFENTGDETLDIVDITFTNPAFSIDYTAFPIQPGESGELPVYFEPTLPGQNEGLMQVWSNDPTSPYEVELNGNALSPEGWNYVNNSGTDFILYGMSLPEGQNDIGYACGMEYTYDADGVIVKTTDGGDNWEQILPSSGTIDGLQSIYFIDENTGFAGGWNNYFIKTTDGGATWEDVSCGSDVWFYTDIKFWDENNGVVSAYKNNVSPGIFVTNDGGDTWTPASGVNYNLWAVEYADQNTLFALNFTGLPMKSIDGGNSWSAMANPPAALLLGLDFANADFGVVGAEEKMFATSDGGDTWTEYFTGYENFYACKAFEDGTAYIGGTDNRIYKTTDFGESWTLNNIVSNPSSLYQVEVMDNGTLFAGGSQGTILRNEENVISGPVLDINPNPVQFDDTSIGEVSSQNVNFANIGTETIEITDITFTNAAFSINYTAFNIEPGESGDLPVNFEPTVAGLNEGIMQVWSNDPNNPFEVDLSGNATIETNMGWQWIETGFDFILMDIQFPEGQNMIGYCVGESLTYTGDGIVIKTTDGGQTWEQMTEDGIPGLTGMSFIDLNTGYAVGWDDHLIKTTDGGETWETISYATGTWSFYYDVEFYDENNGVVLADQDIYVTSDGGITWSDAIWIGASCSMVIYTAENTLIAVGYEDYIYKSTDGGYTWTLKYSGIANDVLLGVHFHDDLYGMATGDYGHILTTTDGGESWTLDTQVGDQLLHTPYIWDYDTAWVCGTPELVYKSTDGGTNWNSAYDGNWQKAFYRITFTDNYTGFICGSGGIVLRKEGLPLVPAISVDTDAVYFEDTFVGESSAETITVTNSGFATLEITDITTDNNVFTVDMTSFTLEPGEEQELEVSFTPEIEGLVEGTLQIESNDPNGIVGISLVGAGMLMLPEIEIEPFEIVFDTTLVNETSVEMVTISNIGLATLDVTDIISSNDVFSVNMTNFSIDPGNSQEVEITFAPISQMMFEGELQIESNDPNGIVGISLVGAGMLMLPEIEIEPFEIVFDTTLVNETSVEMVTISNIGMTTLDVTDIISSNDVFSVNMTNFSIDPGNSQEVEITFAPISQMMFEGELQIESNDPNGAVIVNLEGYGDIDTYVNNINDLGIVNIYPNPAKNIVYVKNIKGCDLYIYDLLGNLKLELHKTANTEQVNVSNFIGGIYIVKIINDRGTFIRKIEVRN